MAATLAPNSAPLADLNTTPLIDVLLVLLILFVITIPAATHSLEVPLPSSNGKTIQPTTNSVTIDPVGTVAWNGAPVSQTELAGLLAATTQLRPEPELRFEPAAQAPYAAAARTLQTIQTSGVSGFGFVGTERFADFARAAD
jgi:biopolymer transport protein ExbD